MPVGNDAAPALLPNVAGVGPAEFAFLLIFGRYMPYTQASAAMLLYRTATCFFPYALSIMIVLCVQRRKPLEE